MVIWQYFYLILAGLRTVLVLATPLVWVLGSPVVLIVAVFRRQPYFGEVWKLIRGLTTVWLRLVRTVTSTKATDGDKPVDWRQGSDSTEEKLPTFVLAMICGLALGVLFALGVPIILIVEGLVRGEFVARGPYQEFASATTGEGTDLSSVWTILAESLRRSPLRFLIGAIIGFVAEGFVMHTTRTYHARLAKGKSTGD
ncbi:MAG: hypothetical protein JSV91_13275 [Phycisphaerales bacterium]|nr:MAG: hypothetical protein JSV91_13275 [Phycisphaerales bacterium]